MSEVKNTPAVKPEKPLDIVTNYITEAVEKGELHLPKNYSAVNALKSAWLYLQDLEDKDKNPALKVCTTASVINALLKMATLGLNVIKGQCYFIVKGGKLHCDVSYQGDRHMAIRDTDVVDTVEGVIYEKDVFEYEIDVETGRKKITKHVQGLDTIDAKNIKGAYSYVFLEDGRKDLTVMTKAQIMQAWTQRPGGKLSGAHENFGDEMAKKTVLKRALKGIIGSSDDSELEMGDKEPSIKIPKSANSEPLTFDDHEEVKEETKAIDTKPVVNIPAKEKVLESVGANGGLFEAESVKKDPF